MVRQGGLAKRNRRPTLTLVLPVYNYGSRLKYSTDSIVKRLRMEKIRFEIVMVNDGSRDKTREIMENLSREYGELEIITYLNNRGKGYAVKAGMLKAKGRFVFFTDADLPYGLEPILKGLKIFEEGAVDVVLGSRDLAGPTGASAYESERKIAKKLFSSIANSILGLGITDTQCGLKGFRREVAMEIFPQLTICGFCFDVEVLHIAQIKKYRIRLIPVRMKRSNTSTVSILPDSIKMLGSLARIAVNAASGGYR